MARTDRQPRARVPRSFGTRAGGVGLARVWLLVFLIAASATAPAGETVRVLLTRRDGVLYVPVRLLGCVMDPVVELLLDTGAGATILPHAHLRRMRDRGVALDIGTVRVEAVSGAASEAREALIDGLRIGTCELPSVRGVTCADDAGVWRPVLGMDVLSRLEDVTIVMGRDGGELRFTCPCRPDPPAGECAPP